MAFGDELRALRLARNLTQAAVAGDELSISYISLLESNRRQPSDETVQILARSLGCLPEELYGKPAAPPAALAVRYADLSLETGETATARAGYQQVLQDGVEDPMLRIRTTLGLAQTLQHEGRLSEAVELYESCVRSGLVDPAHSVSLAATQGWCRCLFELGELYRAIEVGSRALEELGQLGAADSEQSVQLLATVANAWYELGELRQAENLLSEGLERASRVKSPLARGAIIWNASLVAAERGRYLEALELADEALTVFRHGSDPRKLGMLLTVRAYMLLRMDPPRAEEAVTVLTEAMAILSVIPDKVQLAYALTDLSRAHLELGDIDAAVAAAERALEMLGPSAHLECGQATVALASAVNAQGDPDRAKQLFTEAATILGTLGASRSAARAWVGLATTLVDRGDLTGAVSAFLQGATALNLVDGPRRSSVKAVGLAASG
ncbi:MAG: tetratricopeptide repeat protein [Jatrophihabitantaceae bacterium]